MVGASIISRNDRYAREKMAASLEVFTCTLFKQRLYQTLISINSSLNLSEDKKNIFIEVSVDEGEQFKFGETKFLGDALYTRQKS